MQFGTNCPAYTRHGGLPPYAGKPIFEQARNRQIALIECPIWWLAIRKRPRPRRRPKVSAGLHIKWLGPPNEVYTPQPDKRYKAYTETPTEFVPRELFSWGPVLGSL